MDNNQHRHRRADDNIDMMRREIENKIIIRRGIVGNDGDGTPLLINGRGVAYRVNDTAVSLWNMCNGITFDDLFLEVLRISSGDENDVRKSLEQMIKQFHKISVVDVKKMSVSVARKSGTRT